MRASDPHGCYPGRSGATPGGRTREWRQQGPNALRDPLDGAEQAEGQRLVVGAEGLSVGAADRRHQGAR